MTPETHTKIQDYRSRILRAEDLRKAGQEIPPDLIPTDEEIRDAITALRKDRIATPPPKKKTAQAKADALDLTAIFGLPKEDK